MSTAARRIADLEVIARSRQPDGPPTWTFFAQERFQARANYGNQSPHVQTPSGIAGMIVGAYWEWDNQRFGETKAWGTQRSRGEFEGQIAGRLAA